MYDAVFVVYYMRTDLVHGTHRVSTHAAHRVSTCTHIYHKYRKCETQRCEYIVIQPESTQHLLPQTLLRDLHSHINNNNAMTLTQGSMHDGLTRGHTHKTKNRHPADTQQPTDKLCKSLLSCFYKQM
eukprot:GHVS01027860.1.p1 GENE.GHVS01027860.1~~GHVS01027860.1.p1  ORF type:complete len:127 (+),score=11.16 GHVS01027860.1:277-657(+)